MPESRGRTKRRSARYQLEPARKKKPKRMPKWYAPLVLVVMAGGVLLIVGNYLGLVPGTNHVASNVYLWGGLGLIALGFIGTTQIR